LAATLGIVAAPAVAAEKQLPDSLGWVPADVAFYSASLRLAEQVQIVARSNAWKAIENLPAVRDLLDQFHQQTDLPGSPAAQVSKALENPAIQSYLATLCDMFSEEVVVFGDEAWGDCISFIQDVSNGARLGPVLAFLRDPENAERIDPEETQAAMALHLAAQQIQRCRVPSTIIAFKLSEPRRADEQLRAVAGLIQFLTISAPPLQGRFRQEKIAGNNYFVLSLDAKMVPPQIWKEIEEELGELESVPGQARKIVEHLRQLTFVVAAGIRDGWLVVSMGPNTELLASLGTGELLADREELRPLVKFADRKLTSVGYVSRRFRRQVGGTVEDLERFVELADMLLEQADLSSAEKSQIRNDVVRLVDRCKELMPQLGAVTSFSFLCQRGIEAYAYDWTQGQRLDGSRPLDLLEHVGGNPILAIVARGKSDAEEYEILADLIATGCKYIAGTVPPGGGRRTGWYRTRRRIAAPPPAPRSAKVRRADAVPRAGHRPGGQ